MGTLDEFINGESSDAVSFPIADSSDPVNWVELAGSVTGSVVLGTASALYAIPAAFGEGLVNIYSGSEDTYELLIDSAVDPFVGIASGAFDVALIDELGVLAGPAAVIITLAAMYVFVRGLGLAAAAARGGGRL